MASERIYIDTSAYLCVLLGDRDARTLARRLRNATICSSVLLLVEAERNLVRLSREKVLSDAEYDLTRAQLEQHREIFVLRELTTDLCLTGIYPAVRIPRSNDLIHLRSALWFQRNGGLEAFVTLDSSQEKAAQELGLSVI